MPDQVNIEDQKELIQYLRKENRCNTNEIKSFSILGGGVSNKAVQIEFTDHSSWVLKQSLERLRVPGNWHSAPDRIFRESEAMRWFASHDFGSQIPKLIFEDRDQYLLCMEGINAPFHNLKDVLLRSKPPIDHLTEAGTLLATIHNKGKDKKNIPIDFFDRHFFETLRLDPFYRETQRKMKDTGDFIDELIEATEMSVWTLVHGDFSPKNLLIKDGRLILLDHEVIHYGDGAFDLGFFSSHLLSKANHLPTYRREFIEGVKAFWQSYATSIAVDKEIEARAIGHTIGCILARVCGLSRLEYLSHKEQIEQQAIALKLIKSEVKSFDELTTFYKKHFNVTD